MKAREVEPHYYEIVDGEKWYSAAKRSDGTYFVCGRQRSLKDGSATHRRVVAAIEAADELTGVAVRVVFGALRRLYMWPTAADAFLHAARAEGAPEAVWPVIDAAMEAATGHTRACLADSSKDARVEILRATGNHLTALIPSNRGGAL